MAGDKLVDFHVVDGKSHEAQLASALDVAFLEFAMHGSSPVGPTVFQRVSRRTVPPVRAVRKVIE